MDPTCETANWDPLRYDSYESFEGDIDLDEVSRLGQRVKDISSYEGIPLSGHGATIYGREVGDDRVDASRTPDGLICALAVQEDVIHMVTSPEDTGVRRSIWNFCEVTSGVPTDPNQGFDYARKTGEFDNLGYNDSVILRLILDVQKGEGDDHSSTEVGKMSMLGSRLASPRRENRIYWMIASVFQDAMLCTHKASEPKYAPQIMGGTGVTALFDNPKNVFFYMLAYKGGTYRRIYATAVAEAKACLDYLERGLQTAPILCTRLREKQEYFWGTYDNKVFVPSPKPMEYGEGIQPMALTAQSGGANRYQAFENRLLRTRCVLTRKQAEMECQHTARLQNIFHAVMPRMSDFSAIDKDRSRVMRGRYNMALSSNSALQNLMRREATHEDARKLMGDKAFRTLTVGRRDFTMLDAMWIYNNGQGAHYSLNDLTLSEELFVREEVSVEETFKVAGITLRPIRSDGPVLDVVTKTRVGLYEINQGMEDWAGELLQALINRRDELGQPLGPEETGPIYDERPEWVNDDSGLIARCLKDTSNLNAKVGRVVLISGDRRLANQMAQTCNVQVMQIRPVDYLTVCARPYVAKATVDEDLSPYIPGGLPFGCPVYPDTGSISAVAATLGEEAEQPDQLFQRTVTETGWSAEGRRYSRSILRRIDRPRYFRVWPFKPKTRPKAFRSYSRPSSSIYSGKSWRSTDLPRSSGTPELENPEIPPNGVV